MKLPELKEDESPWIQIHRDILFQIHDDLASLIGEWHWKKGERAGNAEEYNSLVLRFNLVCHLLNLDEMKPT